MKPEDYRVLMRAVNDIDNTVANYETEAQVVAEVDQLNERVRRWLTEPGIKPMIMIYEADLPAVLNNWRARHQQD